MSLFPHQRGCVEAVDPLQSCVDATDGSLRSQESLESDPQKHGSRCYGDIGQSRTNKRRSFRKGPAGNTKCTTAFRPAATSDGLQHAPPCHRRRRRRSRRRRRRCWHRLLLSGWQMPEQDVSSQTGLSCETVSSCDTQHLHEMKCIAVNREDLPLRGEECVSALFPPLSTPFALCFACLSVYHYVSTISDSHPHISPLSLLNSLLPLYCFIITAN